MNKEDKTRSIRDWKDGDSVSGFALLTRKERRQDRNGKDFLDLELADASGRISAKVWSGSQAIEGKYEAHDFVAFRGSVSSYRDQLQMKVQECRRATDEDRGRGFDESALIPSSQEDIETLWARLETLLEDHVVRPPLKELVSLTLATYGDRLKTHPAAKTIHHAYLGGLLEHVVSMAELAVRLADHYPELNREILLVGVLFHDLGKLEEIGPMPVNEYTTVGRLVGHVVIGRDMLRDRCAEIEDFPSELQVALEHLVLSHQGRLEYGTPIEPMTAEAFALHFIDDLDSKLNQLRGARQGAERFQYLRPLGRYVYFGIGEDEESAPDEVESEQPAQRPLDL